MIDPLSPSTLYAGTFGSGLFKSINEGVAWSSISQGLPILPVVRSLVVNPNRPSTVYLTLSQGLFRSIDGGTSWKKIGIDPVSYTHLRAHET